MAFKFFPDNLVSAADLINNTPSAELGYVTTQLNRLLKDSGGGITLEVSQSMSEFLDLVDTAQIGYVKLRAGTMPGSNLTVLLVDLYFVEGIVTLKSSWNAEAFKHVTDIVYNALLPLDESVLLQNADIDMGDNIFYPIYGYDKDGVYLQPLLDILGVPNRYSEKELAKLVNDSSLGAWLFDPC